MLSSTSKKLKKKVSFFFEKKTKLWRNPNLMWGNKGILFGFSTGSALLNYIWIVGKSGERERKRKALCRERKKRGERKNINDWGFKVVDYGLIHVDNFFIECVNVWPLMIGLPAKHYDIVTRFFPNLCCSLFSQNQLFTHKAWFIFNKYFPYPFILFKIDHRLIFYVNIILIIFGFYEYK